MLRGLLFVFSFFTTSIIYSMKRQTMAKRNWCWVAVTLIMTGAVSPAQNTLPSGAERGIHGLRFMFYNVENLFDPFDDTLKFDEDFTFEGAKHWSWKRMQQKCGNLARVMIAASGWEGVEMVGMCEVENPLAVWQLIRHPLLQPYGYRYVMTTSEDRRGIDLVFLYRPEKVEVLQYRGIPVRNPSDTSWRTRDILYVQVLTLYADTLHIFLNHWPSRRGGEEASTSKRALAAQTLRASTDSLLLANPEAFILISGDFNDEPSDTSVRYILGARPPEEALPGNLANLMWPMHRKGLGSHTYKEVTGISHHLIDQVIVSYPLLQESSVVRVSDPSIARFPFLLKEDAGGNEVLNRTYAGPQYMGGFSDHLPVTADIRLR
jgi:endonuclease/exonuclease/phosphatase family metal-dependent hydrolase